MNTLRVAAAFLRKDFLAETSYRLSFALGAAGTLSGILIFYFIDKL